jgi:hypothetical protein
MGAFAQRRGSAKGAHVRRPDIKRERSGDLFEQPNSLRVRARKSADERNGDIPLDRADIIDNRRLERQREPLSLDAGFAKPLDEVWKR